ncbi:ATP-dependent RecD-like DNA helicase [Candidatus Xianfuyuplasma coldseepsis]|uniref:ATP-dependent RecD2 DNA helicase n=1 Tax=Candidatus Xianfuyuplasma coldseepsis TaxID=2782163 RepID=A0A7L7KS16_9MOLU|nr:ATP-dependent RecD-like DNA helicase [Xianfuyuplasma coldseepsis]QMS85611.1 ATP-dependent RecD-like DNA helicase [Xianfuyuplasma coldseepsis]
MEYIQGIVKAIIFHSEENSYTIIKIKVTDSSEQLNLFVFDDTDYVTVTGYFPVPMRGEEIKFFGTFKEHSKYGLQYVVKNYEKLSDTSIPGLIEYLSSDLFKGVGIKTAERIVNHLGKDTIQQVLDDKNVLEGVPKLSSKLIDVIHQGLIDNKAAEHTLIQLYGYGITPKMAIKIFQFYQNETIAIIQQNPYQLIYDIEGIGFERADIIAKSLGFEDDHPLRIKAMIMYLYQLMGINYGHTFLYKDQLLDYLDSALNKRQFLVEREIIETYLQELIDEKILYIDDDVIKLGSIQYAESQIISRVKQAISQDEDEVDKKTIDNLIKLFESRDDIVFTTLQKQAIHKAISSNLFILTGGPGTGKTTVINAIVFVYAKYHQIPITYNDPLFEIKLIAPTGRAAKRMNEATNIYAETIHRFLGYGFDGKFIHNKENLVDADVIIIDEASMIDVFLASQLLQSIPDDTKIIIVGDEDQLPSVGPGQVLKDLIDTDMVDYVKLNTIHRQAESSKIIDLAYDVNHGRIPRDMNDVFDDRMFVSEQVPNFTNRLISSVTYLQNQGYDLIEDIQILIPMYKGSTGIDYVNKTIQEQFNTNNENTLEHGDRIFKIGDKVIQLTNQIEDQIMNGDQGIVVGITSEDQVVVDFFGNEVVYKKGDLINLKHAYAMSIHKSQGSEYKVVIMPVFKTYSIMLKRKLLYTGITRAKEKLIVMGDIRAFEYGVTRIEEERQSTLKDDIVAVVLTKEEVTTKDISSLDIRHLDLPFDTFGESLGTLSPYDFMDEEKE